jgi:hypothetical protein
MPMVAATLAVALCLPSLGAGLIADDYGQFLAVRGASSLPSLAQTRFDLFRFMDGDPARNLRLMDAGLLPWWTDLRVRAAFWRPLASLTHWVDYHYWPGLPAVMHAQSLVWLALMIVAVAAMYRRFMGATWVAGLAAILYAVDDAHGLPVAFLANRNAIMATLFGALAVLAHDRWRRDGWRAGAIAGPLFFMAGLFSAEAGIAACAYLFSHALWIDRASWRSRLLALAPFAAVVVLWRAAWSAMGYGVAGIGIYVDPLATPGAYAAATIVRAPVYLLAQWAAPPADVILALGPGGRAALALSALAFLALLTAALWPLLRRDAVARFWACGMLFSVVPICAAFPGDRMLFFVGIGAMGLLAQFLAMVFGPKKGRPGTRFRRVATMLLAWLLIVMHGVLAPLTLPVKAAFPMGPRRWMEKFMLPSSLGVDAGKQDLVIVNAPCAMAGMISLLVRDADGLPLPRRLRFLTSGIRPVTLRRTNARTLVARSDLGLIERGIDALFYDARHPLRPGARVKLTGVTIDVAAVDAAGRPMEATFRFDAALEDSSLHWLRWQDGAWLPFVPPAVGQSVTLSPFSKPISLRGLLAFVRS